jgi:SAM-dependent methyltransferase
MDKINHSKNDYVNIVYNQKERPFTLYPGRLIEYITNRFDIKKGSKILELGCGRGEFLNEFKKKEMMITGVDLSNYAKEKFDIDVIICDLSNDKAPLEDNSFDVIFSKSFIEHFYFPEKIFSEAKRLLKPSGKFINLTPEWDYIYKNFYEDYTHRTPFTKMSCRDIHLINGFINVHVESFKQLPILWNEGYTKIFLRVLSFLTRVLLPDFLKKYSKWIKFSKEIMILSYAEKEKK